jgi:DNA-binding MltR family transcriptional regulator
MKYPDLKLGNYNEMVQVFHNESDRGAAVLAGSYIDAVLKKYLEFSMDFKSGASEMFEANGPLATFSQRIKVALAFGKIAPSPAKTLDLVRKIRNHFAHHPIEASFDESPVKEWVETLRQIVVTSTDERMLEPTRRELYLIAGGMFVAKLHIHMEKDNETKNGA